MNAKRASFAFLVVLLHGLPVSAATHYVNANSAAPLSPYTTWASAAKNIQDAVDASSADDLILVTNGVYNAGGKASGSLSNRVMVTTPLTLQSVNGPAATIIQGRQVAGTTNGPGAVRCVYLTSGAALIGFTLTNGATLQTGAFDIEQSGGGVVGNGGGFASNCVIMGNSANQSAGGAYSVTLSNCVLAANTSLGVGGFFSEGGGAKVCALYYCTLTNNAALTPGGNILGLGGGANQSYLFRCTLSRNSTMAGGGAYNCTLDNCVLSGNYASSAGGGACYGTLNNCALTGNSSANGGGGAEQATLVNCTLTYNSAATSGGGTESGSLTNCLIFYNTASGSPNYSGDILKFCCTTPLPSSGIGNIQAEPQLADLFHLSSGSPCRAAGSSTVVTGLDIDGEAWANPPSIGCDEYHAGNITGPLTVALQADYTAVATNFAINFVGSITGHANSNRWTFGDGSFLNNRLTTSHSWPSPGDYSVVLTAFNESNPGGVSATQIIHIVQSVLFVARDNINPSPPFSSWATAATNIQDAVDAALYPGSTILVSNGLYNTGGTIVYGSMSNRVAVTKPLTLKSVNGPTVTTIQGYQVPTNITGDAAIRCVYLTNRAALIGFTVTNGATRNGGDANQEQSGGGILCASPNVSVSNCVIVGNYGIYGGGVNSGTLDNSLLSNNSAGNGGGANSSTLNNCTLSNNSSSEGGGAFGSTLESCTLSGNSAGDAGGGASFSTLTHCTLSNNFAYIAGGGAYASTVNYCNFRKNSSNAGGGVGFCNVNNSVITANSGGYGGGTLGGTVNNSTITGNTGTGALDTYLRNCIIYYNPDGNWFIDGEIPGSLDYCCTTPLPPAGVGNFTTEPQLASVSHISATSPCRGTGNFGYTSGVDIDGQAWLNPPSVGCDEFYSTTTGPLTVSITAPFTNISAGFAAPFAGDIQGACTAGRWEFGDGTILSNRLYATHAWSTAGDYPVILRAYNSDFPAGVTATQIVHVSQGLYYVALNNPTPAPPYNSWSIAATNIQDAVDAAFIGGTVVVSNGVYRSGGRVAYGTLTNRVVVNKILTLRSVNGPAVTIIEGHQTPTNILGDDAIRCVYLTNQAALVGFTLTNGATLLDGLESFDYGLYAGGGVLCAAATTMVSNCVIVNCSASDWGGGAAGGTLNDCTLIGNFSQYGATGGGAQGAYLHRCLLIGNTTTQGGGGAGSCNLDSCILTNNSALVGGGSYNSTLTNCVLAGNSSTDRGGGDYVSVLNNCTLAGNSSPNGGGANGSVLYNCIIYHNTVTDYLGCYLEYCCTVPLPDSGYGNITNSPLFVNEASANFRLQSASPCINAGKNTYAPFVLDLDGNPRVKGGTVDIGAYECQTPGSIISYAWLQQYGLPTNGSADFIDTDGDHMNNWQEWRAGTDPTNPLSFLQLLRPIANPDGVTLTWQSGAGINYFLQRSTNLSTQPLTLFQTDILGSAGTTTFTDSTATNLNQPYFYRVGVQ